jgi:TPR repeat protein
MKKNSRNRRRRLQNRSKKTKGGMFPSSNSKTKTKATKANLIALINSLGGVDPKLRAQLRVAPGSGSHAHVASQLLRPLETAPTHVRTMAESSMARFPMDSRVAAGLGIQYFNRAQRLRAQSFRDHNITECTRINQEAVELLNKAIELGNLHARAALAEMYLSRDKVGVKPDLPQNMTDYAVDLVSQFVDEPDCRGVLAYYRFKYNYMDEATRLADDSAQAGSKYGQFVRGLIERNNEIITKRDPTQRNYATAHHWFSLAAGQNYDEAQIALSELYSTGKMTMGTKEENEREALRLLELAAEQGNDKAMLFIGLAHSNEANELKMDESHQEEAKRRFDDACRWIGFAVESNNDNAERTLNMIKNRFEDIKPKKSKK